jgi:ketosteroid isomerase-like protein
VTDQSNVQIVRNVYEAFGKGDMEAVGDVLADDIVWRWPGRHPLAGDCHSKVELFKLLGQVAEETSGTERVEVRDIAGQVWKVENGRAVEVVDLSYDPYALDEFFS